MKSLFTVAAVVALVLTSSAKLDPEMAEKVRQAKERIEAMPPAEREAYRAAKEMKRFGGWLVKPNSGSGRVAYVNATKRVDSSYLKQMAKELEDLMCCTVVVQDSSDSISVVNAKKAAMKTGSEAVIFIVDDATLPPSLIATEDDWAIVNIAFLLKDEPSAEKFDARVGKMVWRAFGQLLGAAESQMGGCVLKPVSGVDDLDRLPNHFICPEPLQSIKDHLSHIGVKPYLKATYRDACQMGWAHQPTNEFQKAIWDKVHEAPSKPIVIEPETTKQK